MVARAIIQGLWWAGALTWWLIGMLGLTFAVGIVWAILS